MSDQPSNAFDEDEERRDSPGSGPGTDGAASLGQGADGGASLGQGSDTL